MNEKEEDRYKFCPMMALVPKLVSPLCQGNVCAWWGDNECAITSIAVRLHWIATGEGK